ncbi:MAG: nuclear transport factor 2 family protein [Jatrophihabitans sp.]
MSTDRNDARLTALEGRVALLEDQFAVTQVVLGYGPAVDSGSDQTAAALWAQDGSYEFQADVPGLHGRDALAAMVRSRGHRHHLERGCAHILTAPHVVVDGDSAVATCYSLMHHFVPDTGIFQVSRVSANRWELSRTPQGWQVDRRTNRLLNGDADARELLASAAQI